MAGGIGGKGGGKDPMSMVKGIVGKVMQMVQGMGAGSGLNKMGNGMMG